MVKKGAMVRTLDGQHEMRLADCGEVWTAVREGCVYEDGTVDFGGQKAVLIEDKAPSRETRK
jgi:hypothetical protein